MSDLLPTKETVRCTYCGQVVVVMLSIHGKVMGHHCDEMRRGAPICNGSGRKLRAPAPLSAEPPERPQTP